MKKFPIILNKGDTVNGRFGKHTSGISPAWSPWQDYTVEYVQYNRQGDAVIVVIGGIEFSPYNYEGTVDDAGTVHCFNVEDLIFEFKN